jgi:hypothetical protein
MKRKLNKILPILCDQNKLSYLLGKNIKVILNKNPKCKKQKIELNFISATDTRNYMLKDTLVDWLKFKNKNNIDLVSSLERIAPEENNKIKINNPRPTRESECSEEKVDMFSEEPKNFIDFILKQGIEFENQIIKYINTNKINVVTISNQINDNSLKLTIDYMNKGIPLIASAPIKNDSNKTKGIIDLLIRSDYINKLVKNSSIPEKDILIKGKYYYIVIDIKYSTLALRSDGIHLLNSGNYPAYKTQIWIYTEAIGKIQKYTSKYGLILGRRAKYISKGISYINYNCLDQLGLIDYSDKDKEYKQYTKDAILWLKDLNKNGNKWKINPPSKQELYPNMCINSGIWQKEKELIANNLNEITQLWNVGIKHRNLAHEKNIKSWKNKKCISKTLGINGKRGEIIDKIIEINQNDTKCVILPKKIETNLYDWRNTQEVNNQKGEIFVDFESISDIYSNFSDLPKQLPNDLIFLIGIYWKNNGNWEYKSLIINEYTIEEEFRIMNEFTIFVKQLKYPKIWYWNAEPRIWKHSENKQFDIKIKNNDEVNANMIRDNWKLEWIDLWKIFTTEPIVIKGSFNFGLKSIASAMKKHNLINIEINSNCQNGLTAIIKALYIYKTVKNPINTKIMQDIIIYNTFDCKILYEILIYLRKNH